MTLFLAILWTIALAMDIISCATGSEPNWVLVFCPLIALVADYWTKYLNEKMK